MLVFLCSIVSAQNRDFDIPYEDLQIFIDPGDGKFIHIFQYEYKCIRIVIF